MMNNRGQIGIETFLYVFIAVIVGIILFQAIAQNVGETTNTIAVSNESISTVSNNTAQYITNYRALSNVVVFNATGNAEIDSSYYTIENNVVNNGALAVKITPGLIPENYTTAWQVSGTGQPLTYVADSGGRAMANLIPIFFALLIAMVALSPTMRSGILEMMGK
jgi:uncharacterized protein (UPF0333 family)